MLAKITPGIILKSYTFFKPLDLNRPNNQKKTLINTNILIDLIYYLLFNIFHTYLFHTFFSLSTARLSLPLSLHVSLSISSMTKSPIEKKKKKPTACLTLINNKTITVSFCCYGWEPIMHKCTWFCYAVLLLGPLTCRW